MSSYIRPNILLKNSGGDVIGTYQYEYQAVAAAKLQVADTYTLERPNGTLVGGTSTPPVATIPTAPTNFVATAVSPTVISYTWTDNSDNELGFEVEQSLDGVTGWTPINTTAPTITAYASTALTPETIYYGRVRAVNDAGASAYTNVDSDTTLAVVAPSTDVPTAIRDEIEGKFQLQPQDANGWTILTPNAGTLVYYIDPINGDDATGTPYAYNAFANMQEPTLTGLSTYKTLAGCAGWKNGSANAADRWMLLLGGADHTFGDAVNTGIDIPWGLSHTERSVIAGYAIAANGMPRMPYCYNHEMRYWAGCSFTSIIGIDFYSPQRDPNHAEFVGFASIDSIGNGIDAYGNNEDNGGGVGENWNVDHLIEGCRFVFSHFTMSYHRETIVRRNTFLGNYGVNSHAQGTYCGGTSALLEENIYDHTGWYQQAGVGAPGEGQATIFNHNTYFSNAYHCIFRKNIFARPSSICNKFTANPVAAVPLSDSVDAIRSGYIIIENNFYMDGEVILSLGGNDDRSTGPRWEHMYVVDNFATDAGESEQTDRQLGWIFDVQDWQVGVVSGNVTRGTANNSVGNNYSLKVHGHCSDISINNNVFFDSGPTDVEKTSTSIQFQQATVNPTYTASTAAPMTNISFDGNYVQNQASLNQLFSTTCTSGVTYTNNVFYGASTDTARAFSDANGDVPFATWNAAVGGTNSQALQGFVDPTRDQASYMASIGLTATKQAFIDAIRAQSYDNWNPLLTGGAVSAYMLAGFVTT